MKNQISFHLGFLVIILLAVTACKKKSLSDAAALVYDEPTTLVSLGNPLSTLTNVQQTALAAGTDAKPIVAQHDGFYGSVAIKVHKWASGTTWTDLGSPGTTRYRMALAIDLADQSPLVAYCDATASDIPVVKKWSSGTTWTAVGSIGGSSCTDIAFSADLDSNLMVVAKISGNLLTGHRYSGSTWSSAGTVASYGFNPNLTVGGDGLPVLSYANVSAHTQVKKFSSGTTWTDLGEASTYFYNRITLDIDGQPLVTSGDGSNSFAYATRYNGSAWESLGNNGVAQYRQAPAAISLADNLPYLLYRRSSDGLVFLQKGDGTTFTQVGTSSIHTAAGFPDAPQMITTVENDLLILTADTSSKVVVFRFE